MEERKMKGDVSPPFMCGLDVLQYFESLHIWIWPMNVGAAGPQSAGEWAGVESQ